MNDTTQKPLVRLAERAQQIADELRVRAHLASKDAKDAWDAAHLERLIDEIAAVRDDVRLQIHLAGMDAKDALDRIEKRAHELRGRTGGELDRLADDLTDALGRLARAFRGEKPPVESAKS